MSRVDRNDFFFFFFFNLLHCAAANCRAVHENSRGLPKFCSSHALMLARVSL